MAAASSAAGAAASSAEGAAASSVEETDGSLLIGGLHAAVRLDAPAEVLAGAWLRASVVLAVSREDARLRAEWRLLLDGVGCRASVSGADGALLPIAAEMQRTPEPDGLTISLRMHITSAHLVEPCTHGCLHVHLSAPAREHDNDIRTSLTAADPFDGSGGGGSALPLFLRLQAGREPSVCRVHRRLSLVQPVRLTLLSARRSLCTLSLANAHPTASLQVFSAVPSSPCAAQPSLLSHDDLPATLPPAASLLLACRLPPPAHQELLLSVRWAPLGSLETLAADLPVCLPRLDDAPSAPYRASLSAPPAVIVANSFSVSVSVTNEGACAADLVLCADTKPAPDAPHLLCLSAVTPLGFVLPKATTTATLQLYALTRGPIATQLQLYVQDLDTGDGAHLPHEQCYVEIFVQ